MVYNGTREDYPYYEDLYEYFEQPELARLVMSKPYILVNLTKSSDVDLLSHDLCGPMELLFKRASRANFTCKPHEHKQLLRRLPTVDYLDQGFVYALEVGKKKADEIIEAFVSIYPELKKAIMRAVLQAERRREAKGMQQGRQEEKLGIARTMPQKLQLGIEIVQQATGLSKQELDRL